MTERDTNIICGVIVASFLDFNQKERLCALVRASAQQLQWPAGGARGEADARERDAGTPQSTGVLDSDAALPSPPRLADLQRICNLSYVQAMAVKGYIERWLAVSSSSVADSRLNEQ